MSKNREPGGIPTGGRWATESKTESDVDLTDTEARYVVDERDYESASIGAFDALTESTGSKEPVVFSEDTKVIVADQTRAFIEKNRELINASVDDPDDTGYMIGRDFFTARNTHEQVDRLSFSWVVDPEKIKALRQASREMGRLGLQQDRYGDWEFNEQDLLINEARDEATSPERLAEIGSRSYDQMGYSYWARVAVANNPSTPVATLRTISADESEDDFFAGLGRNPNTPSDLLEAQTGHTSFLVRELTVDHPNADKSVLTKSVESSERQVEEAGREERLAYGPGRRFAEQRMDRETALLIKAKRRLAELSD